MILYHTIAKSTVAIGSYIFSESPSELPYFVQKDGNFYRVDEALA